MACNMRRDTTPFVADVVEDMKMKKLFTKHRSFNCHTCSQGTVTAAVVSAEVFRTSDPRIKYVVTHQVKCPKHSKPHLYFKMHESCYCGDRDGKEPVGRCSTCAHAEPIEIVDKVPSIYKLGHPVDIRRTLYRCTNRKRIEQLNKDDVYMCGYVTCEFYEEK